MTAEIPAVRPSQHSCMTFPSSRVLSYPVIHIKQRSNQRIEACRFLACFMVLFCHVPFPRPYGSCVEALARFAVPFCLMIPGYFTFGDKLAAKSWKKPRNTVETVVVASAV